MPQTTKQIKQTLAQYLTDFQLEDNSFQKFLVIKEYIDYLHSIESLKSILVDEQATIKDLFLNIAKKNLQGSEVEKPALETLNKLEFAKPDYGKPDFSFKDSRNKPAEMINKYYNGLKLFVSVLDVYKTISTEKKKEIERGLEAVTNDFQTMTQYTAMLACLNYAIFDYLNKQAFLDESNKNNKISFNSKTSTLDFKGEEIKITRKNNLTKDHYILEYLFEQDDFNNELYYKDIANEKLADLEYISSTDWNKYYKACQRLQDKIRTSTKSKIDDFLIFNSGKTAHVKINPKYIKSCLKNEPLNHNE